MFRAAVPSGASTGIHEAVELRDGDKARFNGKGVRKAVANINDVLSAKLKGFDVSKQGALDSLMLEIDGTPNKGKLGANAILAVSLAAAKAGAAAAKLPLYQYIAVLAGKSPASANILPVPSFNVINGGEHAGNGLAFQEFMLLPTGVASFSEAMRAGCETYAALKSVLKKKYGQDSVNVGDEGGFAPNISSAEEGLELLSAAIEKAGYAGKVVIGMDVAASEFVVEGSAPATKYDVLKKSAPRGAGVKDGAAMLAMYKDFAAKYPIVSIEDPFEQVRGLQRARGEGEAGRCACPSQSRGSSPCPSQSRGSSPLPSLTQPRLALPPAAPRRSPPPLSPASAGRLDQLAGHHRRHGPEGADCGRRPAVHQPQAHRRRHPQEGRQRAAAQGEPDWQRVRVHSRRAGRAGRGLGRHDRPQVRRDGGHLHRGPGGGPGHQADQDGRALQVRAPGKVQPAAAH
jgi:hypothetical protein